MATEQETKKPQAEASRDGASGGDTLSVTDNRTGKNYEIEINDGTIKTMDLRQIKVSDDDFGLMGYDPAFTNTASCRSAITYIDGEAGVLQHRGIPIEQLCEHSTYLEVAYLLIFGELPTPAQLERWIFDVTHHTFAHEDIKKFNEGFRHDAHPMGMLLANVGALSTFYPDAKHIDDPEERYMAAIRLIAKMPTLAAWAYRHSMGLPYVYPDNELSYSENFISMLFKMENTFKPDPRIAKALDVLFILHADHEQNCSTNAVRSVGSSGVDPYSAVAAGVAALYGPLHGGANEAALRMLRRIETVDNIPDFLESVKNREEKLMGFGHRVYKNYDPRARIIKKHVEEVLEATTGENPLLDIATELEKRALDDDYFTSRKLYPNVDFYSGLIYEAMGVPNDMFTVIFAIPRTSGWVAQWMEQNEDPDLKIARPRQIYTGEHDVDYAPAEKRDGPEKITGPPAKRPKRPRRGA